MATSGGWGQGMVTLFAAGRVAMVRMGRWGLVSWRKPPAVQVGLCAPPYKRVKATQYISRVSGLNAKSPYLDQAFDFIKFLASEPYCEQINRSADNLAAVESYCYADEFLHNPEHPEEDYNDVLRQVTAYARNQQVSPYVNPFVAERIINRYLDLMRNEVVTVEEGCRGAATEINAAIETNTRKYPELGAKYEAARSEGRAEQ